MILLFVTTSLSGLNDSKGAKIYEILWYLTCIILKHSSAFMQSVIFSFHPLYLIYLVPIFATEPTGQLYMFQSNSLGIDN